MKPIFEQKKLEKEKAKVEFEIEEDMKSQKKSNDYARFMMKKRRERLKKIGFSDDFDNLDNLQPFKFQDIDHKVERQKLSFNFATMKETGIRHSDLVI
jgi:hypothetical protein